MVCLGGIWSWDQGSVIQEKCRVDCNTSLQGRVLKVRPFSLSTMTAGVNDSNPSGFAERLGAVM